MATELTQAKLDRLFGLQAADRVALARGEMPRASEPLPIGCLATIVMPLGAGAGGLFGFLATPISDALGISSWALAAVAAVVGAVVPFMVLQQRGVLRKLTMSTRNVTVLSRIDDFTTLREGSTTWLVDRAGLRYRVLPLVAFDADVTGHYRLFYVDPAQLRETPSARSDRLAVGLELANF